jgi:hypothetical protein
MKSGTFSTKRAFASLQVEDARLIAQDDALGLGSRTA